ncbi:formate dehydrogenase accessory protein FdhE [Roseixanthobacter glucoisosaccharinicivorans]|uniref:formate dehydrogenase accessory protein FdhE n=1 Tax=Roseixanthobacter glucoisosaccharinicivorans TaxID=3119923 RepID=UPI0037261CBC
MSEFSSGPGAIEPDPSVIGGIAQPPLAVLPDPSAVFATRAQRMRDLAPHSELRPYLLFLADLVQVQHDIQAGLPEPELPDPAARKRAAEFAMPPLDRTQFTYDDAFDTTFDRLLHAMQPVEKPDAASKALDAVMRAAPKAREAMILNVLADSIPVEAMAEHIYVAAALQVHFARLAARLDAKALVPLGDGMCPCCSAPPVASLIVEWPSAPGARYCACSLCGTLWNQVRVRCVLCGSTKGIGLQEVEGASGAAKAETCDSCHGYTKLFYLSKDPAAEPVADDVAWLGLDLLMRDGPYRRGTFNPFLLGY